MEIRQLEIFRALAEELHFTRAAERVHCVQSNVTNRIRALEDELGTPLFNRLSKRITLTDSGRRILPYVERVLSTIEEARKVARSGSAPAGRLLIGSSESTLTYRLPHVLSTFREQCPEVELSFRPYVHETLLQSIESGTLDLAVCMVNAVDDERLKSMWLRAEKLVFIVGNGHPLSTKTKSQLQDLNGQTILVTEAGCAYRKQLTQLLSRLNIQPSNTIEFSSVEAIKECVALGMGVALLPHVVAADDLAKNRLKALAWAGLETHIGTYAVWHKDKWISPTLAAFIAVLQTLMSGPTGNPNTLSPAKGVLSGLT
jgi:DNA-binding transcriptional LysR family regulator